MITDLTNARQTDTGQEDEEDTNTSPPITDDVIKEDKLTFNKYKAKKQEINAYEEMMISKKRLWIEKNPVNTRA